MIAVALRAHMFNRTACNAIQIHIGFEFLHQCSVRSDLFAPLTPAGAEMGHLVDSVQQVFRRDIGKNRNRHGTADIRRMHARMDSLGHGNASDGNGSDRPCGTGVGHDRTGLDDRGPHQCSHGFAHLFDIGLFRLIVRFDILEIGNRTGRTQGCCRRWHERACFSQRFVA